MGGLAADDRVGVDGVGPVFARATRWNSRFVYVAIAAAVPMIVQPRQRQRRACSQAGSSHSTVVVSEAELPARANKLYGQNN